MNMCLWIQFIIVGPLDLWEWRQYIPSKRSEPFPNDATLHSSNRNLEFV